jgi:hypothetical protein
MMIRRLRPAIVLSLLVSSKVLSPILGERSDCLRPDDGFGFGEIDLGSIARSSILACDMRVTVKRCEY